MAAIYRADAPDRPHVAEFNLDDIAAEAEQCLAQARSDAAQLMTDARREAESIHREAAEAGRREAAEEMERRMAEQVASALPALRNAAVELERAKQAWFSHWEGAAVRLACAIAARLVRRELRQDPEITLALVREALELAGGSPGVRLCLNPDDRCALAGQLETLVATVSPIGAAEIVADAGVTRGGCRVESRFGVIDQQIESQLKRIEEELVP
jgi:flagellar assembly protein FliH